MSGRSFVIVIIGFVIFWSIIGVAKYHIYDNRTAYIEACETMGGQAVIGKMFTKICVKNEYLIISE